MGLSLQKIEAIAPDQASLDAARKLLKPSVWPSLATDDAGLAWGEAQGSGATPYRVIVSEDDAGYKCTCPSRFEGGNAEAMLARVAALKQSGVNVIVLLALSDQGMPAYDVNHTGRIAGLDCPVFACTPDQFPDLMATALTRRDISDWAAGNDIALVRGA